MRRRRGSIAGDPLLIGALTLFLSVVIVYFVYNADSGLPFVPTYEVTAVLPDAQNVARNAEVRLAGVRVGRVGARKVTMLADGRTEAVLDLKLDKSVEPLPAGTSMRMRATSTLGGNYVEILPGRSSRSLRGSPPTIQGTPASTLPTLPDAVSAYDEPTRRGTARDLTGYGDALVGRGADLNGFLHESPRALKNLDGASRTLGAAGTRLGPFIQGVSRLGDAVAPVAEQQAGLFVGVDRTLQGLATVRDDVAESAARAPGTLQAGIDGFPRQRALLRATSSLFAAVAPGVSAVRGASADIEGAAVGAPAALKGLQRLAPHLASTTTAVGRLSDEPGVVPGLRSLRATLAGLAPTVADLRTSQVVCNYPGVLIRNATSAVSDGYSVGNWLTASVVLHLPGTDFEAAPSTAPSNAGPGADGLDINRLHATPSPYVGNGPRGPECEAGDDGYAKGQAIGHPPGRQRGSTVSTRPAGAK